MKIIHKLKSIIKPAVIIPSTLLFLTLTSALVLLSSNSNADTTSATASVTVPDTCYMSSTSTTHTGTVNGGTYTENFGGESTVTVTCNDRNGYSVYAVGYSNDVEGTNGLIGTSTGLVIPSGTSTSGDVSNWAMKLTPGTGTFAPTILSDTNGSFANYHIVPTTTTKVATLTSDINVSNSSQFKTSYAVAVSPSQAADTYIGKVKYTVVHPNYSNADGTLESYPVTLGFGANTSSIVIDGTTYTSSSATPNLEYGTHTISGTYPSGYGFDSWSATGNITITGSASASTTINVTGAGTLALTSKKLLTLSYNMNGGSGSISSQTCATCTISSTTPSYRNTSYASFKNWNTKADGTGTSYHKSASITLSADTTLYAQWTFTSNTLQATTYNSGCSGTKYDARDGNSYTVAQIVNLCWMTKNFNLPGGTTLYPGDTNVPHGYSTTTTGFTNGNTLPASTTSGFSSDSTAYVYNSGSTTCSSASSCYSYYSWRAATAGYNSTSSSTAVAGDICPKGWRLPTEAELTTLQNSYSTSAKLTASPFLGVYAGIYYSSSFSGGGLRGVYWSSTARNSSAYYLNFNISQASVIIDSKMIGNSVRCVAKS